MTIGSTLISGEQIYKTGLGNEIVTDIYTIQIIEITKSNLSFDKDGNVDTANPIYMEAKALYRLNQPSITESDPGTEHVQLYKPYAFNCLVNISITKVKAYIKQPGLDPYYEYIHSMNSVYYAMIGISDHPALSFYEKIVQDGVVNDFGWENTNGLPIFPYEVKIDKNSFVFFQQGGNMSSLLPMLTSFSGEGNIKFEQRKN